MKSTWNVPPARGSSWASFPFQRTYSFGSVSSRKTVSGRAAMVITFSIAFVSTVTTVPPLFFLLRRLFQEAQVLVPVGLEVGAQLGDAVGPRPVQALCAVPSLAHEARLLQDAQVLRDGRPGHLEVAGDLARSEFVRPHQAKDLPPARLGDGSDRGF